MATTSKVTSRRSASRRCALTRRRRAAFQSRSIPGNLISSALSRTWKFDHVSRRLALIPGFRRRRPWRSGRLVASLSVLFSVRAHAHGFGQRYDLPLPLTLWIVGAACTIVLSFLIISIAVRANPSVEASRQSNTLRWRIDNGVTNQTIRLIAQLVAVAALVLVVAAGIIGDQTPTRNLAPTAIWIAWWVGFSYLSAFVGNVWSIVNPWAAIFDWCERILSKRQAPRTAKVNWPDSVGVWPGIALFMVFAWLELIWEGRSIPRQLAWFAIGFSVLTWTGMFIFGRRTWLAHADPFALAFGTLSKFGPTCIRVDHGISDTRTAEKQKVGSDPRPERFRAARAGSRGGAKL